MTDDYQPLWSGKSLGCGREGDAFLIHKAWRPDVVYHRIDGEEAAAAFQSFDAGMRACDSLGLAEWVDAWCEDVLRSAGRWDGTGPIRSDTPA